jgi:hypothetical protein
MQQSITNKPTVPTCHYQPDHNPDCTYGIHQYSWHDITGFTIDKCGDPLIFLYTYFDCETYSLCLRHLTNGKAPSPNKISNSILENLPFQFHTLLYLFFIHCYKQKRIPALWKTNITILLYKKGNPTTAEFKSSKPWYFVSRYPNMIGGCKMLWNFLV